MPPISTTLPADLRQLFRGNRLRPGDRLGKPDHGLIAALSGPAHPGFALRLAVIGHGAAGQCGNLDNYQHRERRIQFTGCALGIRTALRRHRWLQPRIDYRHRHVNHDHDRWGGDHPRHLHNYSDGDIRHHNPHHHRDADGDQSQCRLLHQCQSDVSHCFPSSSARTITSTVSGGFNSPVSLSASGQASRGQPASAQPR